MLRALLCAVLLTALTPASAYAHYRTDARWSFGGANTPGANAGKKNDPINIFVYPYAIENFPQESQPKSARFDRHARQHWLSRSYDVLGKQVEFDYAVDAQIPEYSNPGPFRAKCKGAQYLAFPAGTQPGLPTNSQSVFWGPQRGPLDRCKIRTHMRMWYDDNHVGEGSNPTPHRQGHSPEARTWMAVNIHHENQNLIRPKFPPWRGHYIDQDWDSVAIRALRKFRYPSKDPDHLGATGSGSRLGHCGEPSWKMLPGSKGWFGSNRANAPVEVDPREVPVEQRGDTPLFHSDGILTRIGMNHCERP